MFNLQRYEGKTIRSFDRRGDQVTIYFTDESFLIITAEASSRFNGANSTQLTFQGRELDNETH